MACWSSPGRRPPPTTPACATATCMTPSRLTATISEPTAPAAWALPSDRGRRAQSRLRRRVARRHPTHAAATAAAASTRASRYAFTRAGRPCILFTARTWSRAAMERPSALNKARNGCSASIPAIPLIPVPGRQYHLYEIPCATPTVTPTLIITRTPDLNTPTITPTSPTIPQGTITPVPTRLAVSVHLLRCQCERPERGPVEERQPWCWPPATSLLISSTGCH